METKSFLGIEGLNHFWEKAKIWIINEITTKIAGIVLSSVPVGTVLQGLYTTVPNGFLLCNGQEVAIASFHKLYTEIGSLACCQSSNAGMFKIPDLRNRFLEGANGNLGIYIEAGLPNITGTVAVGTMDGQASTFGYGGALTNIGNYPGLFSLKNCPVSSGNTLWTGGISLNARASNLIYGSSTTVQPQSLTMLPIIKY